MKLMLPKMLLTAVLASQVVVAGGVPTVSLHDVPLCNEDYSWTATYRVVGKNIQVNGEWAPAVENEEGYIDHGLLEWCASSEGGEYTLSGNGTIHDCEIDLNAPYRSDVKPGPGKFTIESGINLSNAYLCAYEDTELVVKGTLSGIAFETDAYDGATVDLTNARINAYYVCYGVNPGCTLRVPTLTIGSTSILAIEDGSAPAYLDGNLVLNGVSFNIQQETYFPDYFPAEGGYVEIADNSTLSVSGSISILSTTSVLYYHAGAGYNEDGYWEEPYGNPSSDTPLFICSSVDERTLSLLQPYTQKEVYIEDTDEEKVYVKPLLGKGYYAKEQDGKIYIYLGETGQGGGAVLPPLTPPVIQPDLPEDDFIVVKPGDNVILGEDEESVPSVENPVVIQGGVADASKLDDALLNNQVIQGTGGTVVTGSDQTMNITGSGSLNYGVTGSLDKTPGANLSFAINGNLDLKGAKYDTAMAEVSKGVVTVSSAATLGMGSDKTQVKVKDSASLTNFGTVAGDVVLEKNASMLNQNKVDGSVVLERGSSMKNNGIVTADIYVENESLLSGSGSARNLTLVSGARLNVGNSPGWQKYDGVTIQRGASLTFTVDGTTAATADNNGAGTHSVLQAKTLTIGDGTDTVKVTVDVAMGIVFAGAAPFEVELMDIETGDAKAADFSITLNDNNLLEDGAEVTWDEASQSMVLSGSVSKTALAALMSSNAANVANTMWASANAVQEFVRTAENQFPVGMPGQSTFWGAGLGSFMDVGGSQGFTSNAYGYAVGVQHAFTESFRAGFALGQTYGDFKSDDRQLKVDQEATLPTLTAQYVTPLSNTSSLSISGHVAYGVIENEADTYQMGTAGEAEWDDKVLNIGVRAAWNTQLCDNVTASLFTGLTYQSVDQDSFTEVFDGGVRDYRSGSMSSLSLPVGVTLRGAYSMGGTHVFAPEVTVAYIADISRDNPEVKTSVMGINRVGKGTNIGRNAFMLNVGANWMLDSTWSVGAFYALEARSNQVNQSVNAALRYSF